MLYTYSGGKVYLLPTDLRYVKCTCWPRSVNYWIVGKQLLLFPTSFLFYAQTYNPFRSLKFGSKILFICITVGFSINNK